MQPIVFGKGGSHGSGGMFGAMVRMLRYLRSSPVDVVYVCGVRASLWVRLLRLLVPTTKVIHGVRWNPDSNSHLDRFFRLVERSTGLLVNAWITNSEAAKRTLVEHCGIKTDHIHVIYNGLDALPEELPKFDSRPLEVLTVANLNPRKGHREFLQVIHKVLQRVPDARFIFIGRDDMNGTVQEAINIAGLQDSVCYQGFQSDVTPWLKRARLFVLPSLWGEGCPTSILEAFSFGVPVIAHAIDGVPELVEDGRDGYLLSVGDEALIDRIVELLINPELAEKMGQLGRAKVAERFVLASCVNRHEAVYSEMVNN
ncbi:glycosyltransferase family 4 protein [Endozoicomonas atrinae]|uniref:glycosyltransferase family 4 protein n=1 Tax=Endozoicomonas atrinae TaxID=1333660 RepID=UPI001586C9B2|nr:glycosyltransferase family 4 protein [Endozoicomonas atrinae]